MTNPVDDLGNPRVDFVWGNMAMQPNDQRADQAVVYVGNNQPQDRGWSKTSTAYIPDWVATSLSTGLSVGDQSINRSWDNVDTRYVTVPTNHEIITTQYEGFPAFIQGSPYDDVIPNMTMPNVVGMTTGQASVALGNVGFTGNVTTNSNVTEGATSGNNGKIASQAPAAGALVNVDTAVIYNLYNYVAPTIYTTGPIAGFNRSSSTGSLNGNEAWMYLVGRTVRPAVGDSIAVTESSDTEHNITWTVLEVIDDNGYNTGGTAVKVHCLVAPLSDTSSGGTWTKI